MRKKISHSIWVALLLALAVPSQASLVIQCVVDGHGPYDMTEAKCLEQARRQARTNCVLQAKALKVHFSISKTPDQIWKRGYCSAEPYKKKEDCAVKKCEYKKMKKTQSK